MSKTCSPNALHDGKNRQKKKKYPAFAKKKQGIKTFFSGSCFVGIICSERRRRREKEEEEEEEEGEKINRIKA